MMRVLSCCLVTKSSNKPDERVSSYVLKITKVSFYCEFESLKVAYYQLLLLMIFKFYNLFKKKFE